MPATTDKGLTITYTSDNEDVATINGNIVTIKNAGVANITATQNGNDYYNAATPVTHQLVVSKRMQAITFDELPIMTFGDAPIELNATANSSRGVLLRVPMMLLQQYRVMSSQLLVQESVLLWQHVPVITIIMQLLQ